MELELKDNVPALDFRDLRVVRGGRCALELPQMSIPAGQVSVLLGPNGSGKSTLLMAAAGLLDLERGRIDLFGQPYHSGKAPAARELRRQLTLVLQEPWLPHSKLEKAVLFGLRLQGTKDSQSQHQVERCLAELDIQSLAGRPFDQLSAGERRLAALAAALLVRPKILLLDETLSGIDNQHTTLITDQILPSLLAQGTTVLVATHDLELATRLGGNAITLTPA